jgi:succinate dehydrogenase / fumarate reductase, cytochrome b subunit
MRKKTPFFNEKRFLINKFLRDTNMNWLTTYLTSSIGRKLTMSLTGLFMILFLIVHLIGNLQLLKDDGGEAFNKYAYFMTHFPLIKIISYGLYFFIVVHTVQGLMLWQANRTAKGTTYAVSPSVPTVSWASKNMALLGTMIFAFLLIHMGDFWWKMHNDQLPMRLYDNFNDGKEIADLYVRCATAFSVPYIVAFYILGQVVLSFHLWHGFQSAFQTLGVNHPKYSPFIKAVGRGFAIVVPALFAIIPIGMYLMK